MKSQINKTNPKTLGFYAVVWLYENFMRYLRARIDAIGKGKDVTGKVETFAILH